jgi:hypothetical protein
LVNEPPFCEETSFESLVGMFKSDKSFFISEQFNLKLTEMRTSQPEFFDKCRVLMKADEEVDDSKTIRIKGTRFVEFQREDNLKLALTV